eukprot:14822.XXX_753102_752709_1 [CDS] Oithona nana genome sequencing.
MKYDLEQAKVSIGSLKCSGREENCPDGWTKLQSKCYQISTVSADFDDAEASCRRKNAKLAEPVNSIENNELYRLAKNTIWIGVTDRGNENQ